MKTKLSLIAILSFCLSFHSCSNYTHLEPTPDSETTFRPGKETGLAIGVIDFGPQAPIFENASFRIRNENAEKRSFGIGYKGDIVLNIVSRMRAITNPTLGIEDKKRYVYLYTVELKEGNYEFYDFTFLKSNGLTTSTVSNCGDFKLPFTITKNKISYLGEITVNQLALLKKSYGKPFTVRDNFKTDIERFKQKYKFLYLNDIENQTITSDRFDTGIFAFE